MFSLYLKTQKPKIYCIKQPQRKRIKELSTKLKGVRWRVLPGVRLARDGPSTQDLAGLGAASRGSPSELRLHGLQRARMAETWW